MRDVLPEIERRMVGDYPDRLRDWQAAVEFDKISMKRWKDEFREAQEKKKPLPPMPNSPVTKSLFDQAASWAMMMTSIGVSPSMAEMTAIASAESV